VSWFHDSVQPRLIDRGMRNPEMRRRRAQVPSQAEGRVLELGAGAGLNLPHYGHRVSHLFALEPADVVRSAVARAALTARFPVTLLGSGAEAVPLDGGSVDTVVTTWTLCSIPDLGSALREVRRVLKPTGRLLFMEHGLAPDPAVARVQARWAPVLRAVAGCQPDRAIDTEIEHAGFRFDAIERAWFDGPRFLSWHFTGAARPH
jgi:SAM-dependent methyltransferase